jgi:hypothetical protein
VNDRFEIDTTIAADPPPATGADTLVQVTLAAGLSATLPVGVYGVSATLLVSGETAPRETNRITVVLAPQMTNLPLLVTRVAGTASFTILFTPALRAGQSVVLALGTDEYLPQPPAAFPVSQLDFVIPNAPVASLLARLRIDGIDSPIIDLSQDPPALPTFLNQRVVIS